MSNTYLSPSCPVAHNADIRYLHLCLSIAIFSTSVQVFPIFFMSPSIVLPQDSLGRPLLPFPSAGVHFRAVFVMDSFPFLMTWPIVFVLSMYQGLFVLSLIKVFVWYFPGPIGFTYLSETFSMEARQLLVVLLCYSPINILHHIARLTGHYSGIVWSLSFHWCY